MSDIQMSNNQELSLLIAKLTESQIITNNALQEIKKEQNNLDIRMTNLEKVFEKRIYIDTVEKKELQKHVRAKVKEYYTPDTPEYRIASRYLFKAIWGELNDRYNVTSYDFLPAKYFEEMIEQIDRWHIDPILQKRIDIAIQNRKTA